MLFVIQDQESTVLVHSGFDHGFPIPRKDEEVCVDGKIYVVTNVSWGYSMHVLKEVYVTVRKAL